MNYINILILIDSILIVSIMFLGIKVLEIWGESK